jgi:hypothetical protein
VSDPKRPTPPTETAEAWRELLHGMADLDAAFLEGPNAVTDERSMVEGYRALLTTLEVALDEYLFGDPARPVFVDVNTPFRRDRSWGGDNTDAWYAFTPIDPTRTYRVSGDPGDSVYFSLTVYNEPAPGEWSDRVVGIANDSDLALDEDGRFTVMLGPRRPDGWDGPFIELSDDAAVALTRDYQADPVSGRRVRWEIEALDPPGPIVRTDRATAAALRASLRWVRTMMAIVPLSVAPRAPTLGHTGPGGANEFAEPYQVPDANYGWSARDACYAFGSYALEPDEALVVTSRPPTCRFWNIVVWNPYMATEVVTDARTSINDGSAVANADGTVTIVIAPDRLPHPNAITTAGNTSGVLAFRWFHAEEVPGRPTVEVVKAADAPTAPG